MSLRAKYEKLLLTLKEMQSVLIAFSGGVDSTFLLYCSLQALPKTNVHPVTVNCQFISKAELADAHFLAKKLEVSLKTMEVDVLGNVNIVHNSAQRCYFCKQTIFSLLKKEGQALNIRHLLEGSNADDISDYRPGLKAVKELNFQSPLQDAHLTKKKLEFYHVKSACLPGRNRL